MAKKAKSKRKPRGPAQPPVEPGAQNDVPAPRPAGRPSRYKPEFCPALQKHLEAGYSMESFAAVAGVSREVVFRWAKKYEDFAEAKARGEAARELFYIRMGQAIATGSLKMLAKEEYVQTPSGEVVRDENGVPYVNKIYKSANCNSAAWIFLTKNMLGWRDKRDVQLSGNPDAPVILSREERVAEIERLQAQRKAAQTKWRE